MFGRHCSAPPSTTSRRRWPGANTSVSCSPPVCFVQGLVCIFFTISLARGQDRGSRRAPRRGWTWNLDSALLLTCCGLCAPWLASPHEGAAADPQLSVFSISLSSFLAQRRICLGHLRDIPSVQNGVRCAEFIMASGADAKLDRRTSAESAGGRHTQSGAREQHCCGHTTARCG